MVAVKTLLQGLDLGKSVAEFDEDLERYFVATNTFHELINDRVDIVAGDKGTGKTAIYRFIQKKHVDFPELTDVNIIAAFNPQGNPVFHSLTEKDALAESQYVLLWKSYILGLVGNWLIKNEPYYENSILDQMLKGLGLRTPSLTPQGMFRKIISKIPDFFSWDSAQVEFTVNESGLPVITPKLSFSKQTAGAGEAKPRISAEDAFSVLNDALAELGAKVWVAFDRLDEAFQGFADMEVSALRALLRTYLDLTEFENIRLKLFLRRDLFRRVTAGGFVNPIHINAKKLEIVWDEEDLLNLLCRRIRQSHSFTKGLDLDGKTDQEVFDRLFPEQVDFGSRRPKTWVWIMRRIRDGNDVKPPRNLIDLIKLSQQAQLRKEDRVPREVSIDPVFEPEALQRGLSKLSDSRVNDTLMAEAGIYAGDISMFRDGKAEHNLLSLSAVFGIEESEVKSRIKPLVDLGFLEEINGGFKIPALYREGMAITQGKAFNDTDDDTTDS